MAIECIKVKGNKIVRKFNDIHLAGYNLIYEMWQQIGSPAEGWMINKSLIEQKLRERCQKEGEDFIKKDERFYIVISTIHYNFILDEIWGWTFKNENSEIIWTPILLVGKEIENLSNDKIEIMSEYVYQFTYLKGDAEGWIWGAGGPIASPVLDLRTFEWFKKAIKS